MSLRVLVGVNVDDESGFSIQRRYVIHAVFMLFLDRFQCDHYLKDIPIWDRGGLDVPWTTCITALV